MKLSLTTSGLLDPKRLDSWVPEKRRAIRKAVEAGMNSAGKEIAQAAQSRMQSVFKVRKAGFVKSMRHKLYAGSPEKFPALLVGSRISWLGIHVRGGTLSGRMLIPLTPEGRRIGRRAFKRVVDALIRSGNAYFIRKNGQAILMAENIKEYDRPLSGFKRRYRKAEGIKKLKRGADIPIAVLVPRVQLKKRLNVERLVAGRVPRLAAAIEKQLRRVD